MRLAQRSTVEREAALEHCELCGVPIAAEHRHVLELATRDVKCACRPCGLLFERSDRLKLIGTGCVGTITVSGLPQRQDHELVVEALAGLLGQPLGELALDEPAASAE